VSKISAAKRKQSGSTSAVVGGNKTPQAPVAAEQPVPAADKVSDVNVTEHVKTALHQSDLLKTFDIAVVTLKGDVRLIGVLDSQAQIDEAIKIARATDGTHAIHAELTLKK
jgi:hyperosmotically inducible periplasmic protein